ncbi:MAG: transcriptional regulator [Corynebacterium sp.]|uniref:transcriptional regulator n=1 Tax=Corynebacterium sp. TaxID=1720 RepID=UPI0026DEF5E6|nr:transcriptional regulator [Corynebacterium sp.]MDO5669108.1 transcriptional regulator [Corynebacterium sp.]
MSLDPVIHPVNRLRICAALHNVGAVARGKMGREMRFSELREQLELTDATLSKQLSALESHGYVTRSREYGSTRAKDVVWVALTEAGEQALTAHLAALREIAGM